MDLFGFDRAYRDAGHRVLAGIDEAGRGPWAGPVVAAAVVLPPDAAIPGLNDSKKLSPAKRSSLYDIIMATAITVGVGSADAAEIDGSDILSATFAAMRAACAALTAVPGLVLVDGSLRVRGLSLPQEPLVAGDGRSASIAAASVIAKVTRDRLMDRYAAEYPLYGFDRHKGYGTQEHSAALRAHGPCPIHRKSFAPVRDCVRVLA